MTAGFLTPADNDYKNGQFKTTDQEIKDYRWLRPLSNREVLSDFLNMRAICLGDAKRYDEARQMFLLSTNLWGDTPQRTRSLDYFLQILKDAPVADKWEALRNEVEKLDVPEGSRSAYFDNRKVQVQYFMNENTNWPAIEEAANDLKAELAEYRKQVSDGDPALMRYQQHVLPLDLKSGKTVRLPAEILRLLDQQLHRAGIDHRPTLSGPLADRTVVQMDQAASAHQSLLRHVGQRGAHPNLDRHRRLSARRCFEKTSASECQPLHHSTNFEPHAF